MSKRKDISIKVIKLLCVSSKWYCQNPNCRASINDDDKFIWEFAHIDPYSSDWPRWDKKNSKNNSFDNLLLLCPSCHTIIDKNPSYYNKDLLQNWKNGSILSQKWCLMATNEWDRIKTYSKKPLNTELLQNWRSTTVEMLINEWLQLWKKVLVSSESFLESYSFILSILLNTSNSSNVIVISNQETWIKIITHIFLFPIIALFQKIYDLQLTNDTQ